MFSMSGVQVKVGFGFRTDAFPGATLRGDERMMQLEGDATTRNTNLDKEVTVEDFFHAKAQPTVSFK